MEPRESSLIFEERVVNVAALLARAVGGGGGFPHSQQRPHPHPRRGQAAPLHSREEIRAVHDVLKHQG